ncbi:MAG: transposase [Patescibacteria group bacterium]
MRPLRIEFPGAFYHITTRGNARSSIFLSDQDREQFLFIFSSVLKKFNWRCYSYCLMGNHYHFVIETIDPTLSKGMQNLNATYTQWYNAKHKHVGHLFQGRFKAFLVEEQEYLLEVIRYVVLNPVRAKMVDDPSDYQWSSYRALAGLEVAPDWLAKKDALGHFSNRKQGREKAYRSFIQDGIGRTSPFDAVGKGGILGSEQFIHEVRDRVDMSVSADEIVAAQRMDGRPTLKVLFDGVATQQERDAAIALALNYFEYSGKAVAKFLGLAGTTVCRIAKLSHHRSQA